MRCQPLSQMQHNRAQIYRWRGAPDWGIVQICIIRRWTLRSHWTYIIYFLAVIHFIPSSYSYRVPSSLCLNFYLVHSTLYSNPLGVGRHRPIGTWCVSDFTISLSPVFLHNRTGLCLCYNWCPQSSHWLGGGRQRWGWRGHWGRYTNKEKKRLQTGKF